VNGSTRMPLRTKATITERCANAVNILNRFHIVTKMNEAPDDVRQTQGNLTSLQRFRLREPFYY
jgi:transposase